MISPILDTMGTIMERIIYNRLLPKVESNNGLLKRDHPKKNLIYMIVNLAKTHWILEAAVLYFHCSYQIATQVPPEKSRYSLPFQT